MGIVDALRYGSPSQATLQAAIAAIGSSNAILSLGLSGTSIWNLTTNQTIPSNITLQVPAGATVNRPSGVTLTLQGSVMAWSSSWDTGAGTTVRSPSALQEISGLFTRNISVLALAAGEGLFVSNAQGTGAIKRVRIYTDQGNGGVGLQMSQLDNNNSWNWQMYANTGGGISWGLAGAVLIMHLLPTGLGLGPNNTPSASFYLQLNGDFAAKPGAGGLWTVPSSAALKDLMPEPVTDGMARLRELPNVRRFTYNGKAGTPDGTEQIGFVAEDLQKVAPELVKPFVAKLEEGDDETTDLLATNLGPMLYWLVTGLKEVDQRLTALEGAGAAETEESHPRARRKH